MIDYADTSRRYATLYHAAMFHAAATRLMLTPFRLPMLRLRCRLR